MTPIVLVFGTSHVGKSTFARQLGARLGWQVFGTDEMGRHPGRPWPEVREPVAEHYTRLSDETIYWFLKVHQDNMWPHLRHLVTQASAMGVPGIFEGSALRPEFLATLDLPGTVPLGLVAPGELVRARIVAGSRYHEQDEARRLLIDKFIARSVRQNAEFIAVATQHGLPLLDVENEAEVAERLEAMAVALGG